MGERREREGDDDHQDVGRQVGESSRWPPGVRFHPTDEELVLFYLKRKICRRRIKPSMIGEVDVYKWEPWDLPEKYLLRKGEKQWFFFSPRDRKYPNGSRSNRATKHGYWKATGKDRTIYHNSQIVGNKKTLVYYRGRAPKGQRTDWVMHEYTLDEKLIMRVSNAQDSYALYKLFMKSGPGPKNGEQYGAPFREEEWEENAMRDCFMSQNDGEDMSTENQSLNSIPFTLNDEDTIPLSDLEDLLLQVSHEQDLIQDYTNLSAYTSEKSKVQIDLEEIASHMMNPSIVDANFLYSNGTWGETSIIEARLSCSESMGLHDIFAKPHVPSADEEFLELKDLNGPMTPYYLNDTNDRDLTFDIDEFFDSIDHFDANMHLLEAMAEPIVSQATHLHIDNYSDEFPQSHALYTSNQLWTHDEICNLTTFTNTTEVVTSGSAKIHANHADSPSQSWFSSSISGFLDSVPSSPAFASENTLISRAFERVSSFRATQNHHQQPIRSNDRGYLFISVLVGLGALFWVLTIGASFKVLKGLWGRFTS